MSETEMVVGAINRLAQAIERLADAYLDVNLPEGAGDAPEGMSLSDAGR